MVFELRGPAIDPPSVPLLDMVRKAGGRSFTKRSQDFSVCVVVER